MIQIRENDKGTWSILANAEPILCTIYGDRVLEMSSIGLAELLTAELRFDEGSDQVVPRSNLGAALWFLLSYIQMIQAGEDPISQALNNDAHWIIGSDPVFRSRSADPRVSARERYFYGPVVEWLESLGIPEYDLPVMMWRSRAEAIESEWDPDDLLIQKDHAKILRGVWEGLSDLEKAAMWNIGYCDRGNFVTPLALLTGGIARASHASAVIASQFPPAISDKYGWFDFFADRHSEKQRLDDVLAAMRIIAAVDHALSVRSADFARLGLPEQQAWESPRCEEFDDFAERLLEYKIPAEITGSTWLFSVEFLGSRETFAFRSMEAAVEFLSQTLIFADADEESDGTTDLIEERRSGVDALLANQAWAGPFSPELEEIQNRMPYLLCIEYLGTLDQIISGKAGAFGEELLQQSTSDENPEADRREGLIELVQEWCDHQ